MVSLIKKGDKQYIKVKTAKGIKILSKLPPNIKSLKAEELNQFQLIADTVEALTEARLNTIETKIDLIISALKIKETSK